MATKRAARRPAPKKAPAPAGKSASKPAKGKGAPAAKKGAAAKKAAEPPKKGKAAAPPPAPETPATEAAAAPPAARRRATAEQLSEKQREISISEFFTKNRHLLGFDNASRALLTSIKEAVDNSLDACEEAGILPEITVRIDQLGETRFTMTVEDNGPGIVKNQIHRVFGKLLYGSKFHRLRQSRGQQGIGISAAVMYGQLTTGKPVVVTSKTGPAKPAYTYQLFVDTKKNEPQVVSSSEDTSDHWKAKQHGTSVSIEMEASYKGGRRSVDEYIQAVALSNPHVRLEYWRPGKPPLVYPRVTEQLPPESKEIKPHPYGVELGALMHMLKDSGSRHISGFLQAEFSRVSQPVAAEICQKAGVPAETSLKALTQPQVEAIYKAISQTKIMSPPTNCLAPIGEGAMIEGLKALLVQQHFAAEEAKKRKAEEAAAAAAALNPDSAAGAKAAEAAEAKVAQAIESMGALQPLADDDGDEDPDEVELDEHGKAKPKKELDGGKLEAGEHTGIIDVFGHPCFVTAVTRAPKVYRGNPFQVEAALAYGGELEPEELAEIYRFANRVPLLYQQGACAMTQAVSKTSWKSYDVQQAKGALPLGPVLVMVHIASVWVPFTSEAKEAVAHYDEIIAELKLALQETGRRLSRHIRRKRRIADMEKKAKYIEQYIPHIGIALQEILALPDAKRDRTVEKLTGILERSRKM